LFAIIIIMKIYLACSIRGGRNDAETYAELASHIKLRAILLTELFADKELTSQGMDKPDDLIWQTDIDWIKETDAVIAEVTNPSLGVGYEIAKAEEWGKPVLALYHPFEDRRLSAMIVGSPKTEVVYYNNLVEAKTAINDFINNIT